MIRWKNFLVGGLFTLAALGGIFALRDTAFANLFISAWTGLRLNSGLVLHYTFDGKDMIDGTHTIYTSTGFLYPGAHSGLSGYGDGNGFETTQGSGSLDVVDGFGLTDLSSGTGNATDGCGTFPQAEDDLHVFRDFNISLPAGATVDGVFVMPYASSTLTGTNIFCVALSWGAGTTTANSSGDIIDPVTYYSSGQSSSRSENWGRSWSTTDLSNANFRVYIAPDPNNSNARNFFLDALSVTVSYHYTTTDTAATVKDVSGQGNDGSVEFGSVKQGKIGQGMEFAYGKNSGVSGGSGSSITDLTQKTACAWTYPRSFGDSLDDSTIVSKMSGLNGWALEYADDLGTGLYFFQGWSGVVNPSVWYTPLTTSYLNQWHHVCVSYDDSSTSNNATLYIDGSPVQVSSSNAPSGTVNTDNGQGLYVGWWYPAPTGSFDGVLDDVRVYNRILSASEIKKLYLMGASMVVNSSHRSELTDGLVGYWTFDGRDVNWSTGTVNDVSGQGAHAGMVGLSTSTSPVVGKIGQGMQFGYNTTEELKTGLLSSTGAQKTICAWIKPRSYGTSLDDATIVKRGDGGYYWYFQLANDDGGLQTLYFGQSFSPSDGLWRAPAGALTLNEWQHVCVSYDASSASNDPVFYVNATLQSATDWATPSGTYNDDSSTSLHIGNYDDGVTGAFDGVLDDVRVYNRILSASEIKKLYLMGASMQLNASKRSELTSGLVGYWTFDGRDVDIGQNTAEIRDVSGNGSNGDWRNHATTTAPGKIGQALQFDGVDEVIGPLSGTGLPLYKSNTAYSISLWEKGAPNQTDKTLWGECQTAGACGAAVMSLGTDASGASGKACLWLKNDASTVLLNDVLSTGTAFDNTWHHLVWTDNNGSAKLYIDGAQDATNFSYTRSGAFTGMQSNFIGAFTALGGNAFAGSLDDLRIYNRALSADEVKQLYLMGK